MKSGQAPLTDPPMPAPSPALSNSSTFARKPGGLREMALADDKRRRERASIIRAIITDCFAQDPEFQYLSNQWSQTLAGLEAPSPEMGSEGLRDVIFAVEDEPHVPDEVFSRLRWGGQFVYASRDPDRVAALPEEFGARGFLQMRGPTRLRLPRWKMRLPFWSPRVWYFVARKVYLVRPREISDRFTFHVQLEPRAVEEELISDLARWHALTGQPMQGGSIVMKEIPSLERVIGRLRARFTDLPFNVIERRALNFTEKVFPLFLTREAAMLKVLERDLPGAYAHRVPHVLGLEKDGRGYVRRLWMNWLRNGSPAPLSQIEFARQFAELLHILHDRAGIVHLDLRLDNVVITEGGVGFVDFGSAVRLGENIAGNTLLSTLFEELMKTSQIQRMLERMTKSGAVTSNIMREAYGKVDKAVDLFFLAVQMSNPTSNPDLRGLIRYEPHGAEADALNRLRQEILRPPRPDQPTYRSASDILQGIVKLQAQLSAGMRQR